MATVTDEPVDDITRRKVQIMTTPTANTPLEKSSRFRANKAVAAGLAVGVLGGTAAGLVFGVPGLSNAASSDVVAVPAAVVQQVDPTDPAVPADAPDAPHEAGTKLREALQPLVDDNTITAEQADAVTKQLVENRPDRGDGGFEGRGPGGHRGGPGMFGRGMDSQALTTLLGIDGQELMTQLRDGSTLADIATAQGVEPQAVIDVLVADAKTHLDQAVTDGRIDQAAADQKLADATTKITDMVNNGRPDRGPED